ncbi:MAG TPA: ABC transporter ATP-binding protein, partial [Anaerolineae bacterium]|nr:ABC transporter ATP-binding protein [Anaerolineae bacterium]
MLSPTRWLISHTRRYFWLPLIILIAALINNFAYSYLAVIVGNGFDLITQPNWTTTALTHLGLLGLLAATTQATTALLRNGANELLASRLERDIRDELYQNLLAKSQTFHSQQRLGDLMARATNDVRAINQMFSPGLMTILDATMGAIAPFTLIFLLDYRLLPVPILFFIGFLFTLRDYARQLGPVSIAMRHEFGLLNAGLNEALTGIEVVKSNVQEESEKNKFKQTAAHFRDYFIQEGYIQARYLPLLIFSLGFAFAFAHSIYLWQINIITLGQAVAFLGLFRAFRFPIFVSIFAFTRVQLGLASAQRILEIMTDNTRLDAVPNGLTQPIHGQLTFDHVSFGYDDRPTLHDISFTIPAGATVAIVGQTGSGKTTLTQLINRLYDPTHGRILLDNHDLRHWQLHHLRAHIATIEQDITLFSRSIADNIAFGRPSATRADIEAAAQAAQAHHFITNFPHGYDTIIGERGVTLSGGQRQRLAIARALLTRPRILILDDSTSAIDSATEDKIQQAIRHISRQQTTFLITHRLSQIRWADHILVLDNGHLLDQGTHDHLITHCPLYQQI